MPWKFNPFTKKFDYYSTTPGEHHTTHEDGGSDEVDVTDLSGVLADAQVPQAHDNTHHTETYITDIIQDVTPRLGGDLDMNRHSIGGNTETEIDDAVAKRHAQNTDAGTSQAEFYIDSGGDNIAVKAHIQSVSNPHSVIADQVEISKIDSPIYDDIQDFINNTLSSGRSSGGVIGNNGGGTVSISAGTGYIKSADSAIAETKAFSWSAVPSLLLTDNAVNYIYVDYNGGNPLVSVTTTRSNIRTTDHFTLGRVYREGLEVDIINSGTNIYNFIRRNHERLVALRVFERVTGGLISEAGTRNVKSTAGEFYIGANSTTTPAQDTTPGGGDTFSYWYLAAGGGWTEITGNTQINNLYYDDGSGTLAELTPNRYGVHWVYILYNGDIHVVYGTDNYKLADAQASTAPGALPLKLDKFSIIAARIIIQKNAASFTEISSAYTTPFPVSSPVEHNNLGGLQGGVFDEYYHFSSSDHTLIQDQLTLFDVDVNGDAMPCGDLDLRCFESDVNDDLMPLATVVGMGDQYYELDGNYDIVPRVI